MSSEVEETLKRLVGHKGVIGTIVVNSDGIVSLFLELFNIQCKPLNVITLGQGKSDNIKRMITLTEDNIYQPYQLYFKFWVITELKIKNLISYRATGLQGRNRLQVLQIR